LKKKKNFKRRGKCFSPRNERKGGPFGSLKVGQHNRGDTKGGGGEKGTSPQREPSLGGMIRWKRPLKERTRNP